MPDEIAVGSRIQVKVVKQPTNAAAAKTIVRLLSKAEPVQEENRRLRRMRDTYAEDRTRAGRLWTVRVPKQRPVKGEVGESGTLKATVDVIRDLGSVARFVEITAA